ncbi:WD40 repeat-like protein [Rhizopus microsporus var. microsporus]|uniref:WD40 repeat-like protein n=1 Tax=Rhizopus microsporus var. microsporus TaxID=86635 RepID=A0A1X0RFW2_RHIZD|nr:WD40 repeat-like protein [Rhizopus microsporus var. microsporus]
MFEAKYNELTQSIETCIKKSLNTIEQTNAYATAKRIYDYVNKSYFKVETGLPSDIQISSDGIFKSISWHPHQEILAVADRADRIYLYTKQETTWKCQVLEHVLMKDIRCIEWKPKATGTLAVGCKAGVCVWNISIHLNYISNTGIWYHPAASMQHLEYPEQECVTAIAWDPSPGSHLLAIASSASSALIIHDMLLNRTVALKRYGKGNTIVRWSNDGKWLFVGGTAGVSRIWSSATWASKQLKNPPGLWVQAACWLPDNMTLLYSMKSKNDIHALCLSGPTFKQDVWDIKMITVHSAAISDSASHTGNTIQDIAIDRRYGQRIAVFFENSPIINLYNVQLSPLNIRERKAFHQIGYIRGAQVEYGNKGSIHVSALKNETKPLHISFSSFYKQGAVLAIAWDNGVITFVTHNLKITLANLC